MQVQALIALALLAVLSPTRQATNLMYRPFEKVVADAERAGRLDGSVSFQLARVALRGDLVNLQAPVRPNLPSGRGPGLARQ